MTVTDTKITPTVELISIPNSIDPRVWWFLIEAGKARQSGMYRTETAARADFAAGTVSWQGIR